MEQQNAPTEDALFYNLDNTREARPADYPQDNITTPNTAVARLNGNDPDKRIGPSIILKVMAGDTIQAAVRAFYRQQATKQNNAGLPAEQMLAGLLQAFTAPAEQAAAMHSRTLAPGTTATGPGLTASDLQQLRSNDPRQNQQDKPKAYLNYVFFDNQFNFVGDGSGVKQVDGDPGQLETLASGKVVVKKSGYVYVYTSNESDQDVLFDNLGVEQITGPILEEDHYYPYGLVMDGISTMAPLKLANDYKYNGKLLNDKEFADGTGLDWYSYGMREYDVQIARFPQLDPLTDEFAALTPYQYASDEPIGNVDLDGLEAASILSVYKEAGEYVLVAAAKPVTAVSVGKAFFKGFGKDLWGAVEGTVHAVTHLGQTVNTIAGLSRMGSVDQLMLGMALYQQGRQTLQTFKAGNANAKAEIIGAGAGELLQIFGGEVSEVGKLGEIGKLGEAAGDVGKVAEDASKLEEAAKTEAKVIDQATVHGNSLKSLKPTWGYKLYSQDGTFLKNGITSKLVPESRYTKSFMSDKFMQEKILFPNRKAAWDWEFQQNLIQRGPLNLNMH
jgi:RHS repeat-associated protein